MAKLRKMDQELLHAFVKESFGLANFEVCGERTLLTDFLAIIIEDGSEKSTLSAALREGRVGEKRP